MSLEAWLIQDQAPNRPPQGPVGTQRPWVPRSNSQEKKKKKINLLNKATLFFAAILPLVFGTKETVTIFAMSRATALLSWGQATL